MSLYQALKKLMDLTNSTFMVSFTHQNISLQSYANDYYLDELQFKAFDQLGSEVLSLYLEPINGFEFNEDEFQLVVILKDETRIYIEGS